MEQYQLWFAHIIATSCLYNEVATTDEKQVAKSLWWVAQGYGRPEDWRFLGII